MKLYNSDRLMQKQNKKDINVIWNLRKIPFDRVLKAYGTRIPPHGRHEYKVFCPFHDETRPSFNVDPDKNVAYCFSCSEGWDTIGFIRKKEDCRFYPALAKLASIGGYDISPDLLREISQSFGGVWSDPKKVREVFEARRQDTWGRLTIKLQTELMGIYHSFPHWRRYHREVEWVWEEYETIVGKGLLTMEKFDQIKDWYRKVKKFLRWRVTVWVGLENFKREVYEERVGRLRNRR